MVRADQIITKPGLLPHPEGGFYRQTWVGPVIDGRASGTAILFLLQAGQNSHWHRVDADEIWVFNAGAPLLLRIAEADLGPAVAHQLGPIFLAGDMVQMIVPKGWWLVAETTGVWSLASCTVNPGFQFAGFELAAPDFDIPGEGWGPAMYPIQV